MSHETAVIICFVPGSGGIALNKENLSVWIPPRFALELQILSQTYSKQSTIKDFNYEWSRTF